MHFSHREELSGFVNFRIILLYFCRSSSTEGAKLIDASGHGIPELLEAILEFFPLDTYVFNPVTLMDLVNSDKKKDMEVGVILDKLCKGPSINYAMKNNV